VNIASAIVNVKKLGGWIVAIESAFLEQLYAGNDLVAFTVRDFSNRLLRHRDIEALQIVPIKNRCGFSIPENLVNDISRFFEVEHQDGLIASGVANNRLPEIDCEVIEIPLHIRRKPCKSAPVSAERLPGFASSLQKKPHIRSRIAMFSSSFPPKAEVNFVYLKNG